MKYALITGITGQDGSYLAELLLSKSYKVFGLVRRSSNEHNLYRIDHIKDKLNLRDGDVTDHTTFLILHEIISEALSTDVIEVYNLSAQSDVSISFKNPDQVMQTNLGGVLNLLSAAKMYPNHNIRIYQASTSEQYGKVLEIPQNENTPFNPQSPYAISKTAAHHLMKVYRDSYNMFCCCGTLFNHESPRRGANFVTRKITMHVTKTFYQDTYNEETDCLYLGNLNSLRDWGYAKDYVVAMWLMLQQTKPKDYVISTGKHISVREFVTRCFKHYKIELEWEGQDEKEVGKCNGITYVRVCKNLFRPCEVELLLGDSSLATKELGWTPTTNIDDLITIMLKHDLEQLD